MAPTVIQSQGALQVAGPASLAKQTKAADAAYAKRNAAIPEQALDGLAAYIRRQYDNMRVHRNGASGWSTRLLDALRVFNGSYDPVKLAEIKKFGGSEVYARLISMKCRGTSSLLRDVYLNDDMPWGIDPPADPQIPADILDKIATLVHSEVAALQQAGQPIDPGAIRDRAQQLTEAARQAEKRQAEKRAKVSEDRIQEILVTGGFYRALAEFITDLPLFPVACIKGPVVKIIPTVDWSSGQAVVTEKPTLTWQRVSPFDLWWSGGAATIEDADVVERSRLSRGDLNDLLDLPGYDHDAVRTVLDEYGRGGLAGDWDTTDSERAKQESRESPLMNQSGMITCLEFNGNVQGRLLLEQGFSDKMVPDPLRDYTVQAWLIGRYVIKVQMTPSPRKRHPYFVSSFEKVPGTPVGNALPDILADVGDIANATLRALVNNMSISSGPQVVVNDDRLASGENGDELYPWKRWHVQSDPMGNTTQVPVSFFMPTSNAQELLGIYQKFSDMADEMSAIPKFMSGTPSAGIGRTSSGLSMLMANASKILQTVAANIDGDVISPALQMLFDMIMLTDTTGILRGDEAIRIMGVNVATQRETERVRQLEFLQVTANPIDTQIMGVKGRATVLRSVSETIGLPGADIVPSDDMLDQMQQQHDQQAATAAQGNPQGDPGEAPPGSMAQLGAAAAGSQHGAPSNGDIGPRTNLHGGVA
jgi:hypothetical protein